MRRTIFIAVGIVLIGTLFYFDEALVGISSLFRDTLARFERVAVGSFVEELQENISEPPPLRATHEAPQSLLTRAGVITWTNRARASAGLPALQENARLNVSARAKLEDMFAEQYFRHESPSGAGPADLAKASGYEFIAIGENLALGNYENDQTLVDAWLASPGHRANILNARYTEIGVAVERGTFEGRLTWLAVQEFGLPRSACPEPDATLRDKISSSERELDRLTAVIEAERQELAGVFPQRGPAYRKRVEAYNDLVRQYNTRVAETQAMIEIYNEQVRAQNDCFL